MRWWDKLRLRFRSLVRSGHVDRELDAELRFHLDELTAENIAAGMPPDDARRAARRSMGGLAQVAEECRDMRRVGVVETTWQDLRFGARLLAKHPGFTCVTLATLAVGVGFNTLAFSAGRALLFAHLPVRAADRLVLGEALREGFDPGGTSLLEYTALRREEQAFASTALSVDRALLLRGSTETEPVQAAAVSPGFFETLGTVPAIGRSLTADESRAGGPAAVLLSYSFWQRRFGADPHAVGQQIRLDDRSYTIVGVLPRGFDYPNRTQAWIALDVDPDAAQGALKTIHSYIFVARLRDGVSRAQALDRVRAAARRLAQEFPQTERGWSYGLLTMRQWSIGDDDGRMTRAIDVLLLAIGFLLLICCVNVASLLLVRGVVRERELAIRVGLGASARRVTRQLFTEGALLSAAGAAAGLLLASMLRPVFQRLDPIRPHAFGDLVTDFPLDSRVLMFCATVSVLSGLIFMSLPALKLARVRNPVALLRERERRAGGGTAGRKALRALVIVEIALAVSVSFGGALLTKSFYRLGRLDVGFRPQHLLTMALPLSRDDYPAQTQKTVFVHRVLDRVRALPGVSGAGVTTTVPMQDFSPDAIFTVEGHPPPKPSEVPIASLRHVSAGYVETLGETLVKGRLFTDEDRAGTLPVAVISEELSRQAFGGADPLGKRLRRGRQQDTSFPWMTVVGVVRDVKEDRLNFRVPRPVLYVPLGQRANAPNDGAVSLVLRTDGDPTAIANAARAAIRGINPHQAIGEVSSMDAMLDGLLSSDRFSARVMALLALVGIFLAAIGLYTVIAYSVSQRTGEIGLRVALGAQRPSLVWMVVREAWMLVALGLALSAPVMLVVAALLSNVLFSVSAADPMILGGLVALLTAVTASACIVPVLRALRLDPIKALQYE